MKERVNHTKIAQKFVPTMLHKLRMVNGVQMNVDLHQKASVKVSIEQGMQFYSRM